MLAFGQLLKNSTLQSRLSLFLIVAAEISVRFIEDQLSVRPHCCKERLIVLVQILKPNFRLRMRWCNVWNHLSVTRTSRDGFKGVCNSSRTLVLLQSPCNFTRIDAEHNTENGLFSFLRATSTTMQTTMAPMDSIHVVA
jgi:hypothetical protein